MSKRFNITHLSLDGLKKIERLPIADSRGFLERLFCADSFAEFGLDRPILQMNRTLTRKAGTVRGMHYQTPPYAEDKIISCLRGSVFDVAIDLRANSPTFLKWHGEILSEENHTTLLIPQGFAHGFQTLTEDCEMLYFHTQNYTPEAEAGVSPVDPVVAIKWPNAIAELSERDAAHAPLSSDFAGV